MELPEFDKSRLTNILKQLELEWAEPIATERGGKNNPVQIRSSSLSRDKVAELLPEYKDRQFSEQVINLIAHINKVDSKIDAKLPEVNAQNFGTDAQYRIVIGNAKAFMEAFPEIKVKPDRHHASAFARNGSYTQGARATTTSSSSPAHR